MMDRATTFAPHERRLLSMAVLVLSAYLALPSLVDAWRHDLYSRGGAAAFAVWITALIASWFPLRRKAGVASTIWPVCAALLCALGSMSSLRVLYHAALVVALVSCPRLAVRPGMLAALGALAWLPSAGWIISRFQAGGLAGWERPMMAGMFCILLFIAHRRSTFISS